MLQLIAPLLPKVLDIVDQVIPDKDAAAKAKVEMEARLIEAASQANIEQIKTNQAEAQHSSIWVAGWRPAIGWACASGIAWVFILQPVASWALALAGVDADLPGVNTDILLELTFAMLGMAGLRTFEKMKGVAK